MATDLTSGSVPQLYREVYDIVCPNQEHVDHDMFLQLLVKSSLPKQTLSQIWEAVDNRQGFLTRTGLYKALALTALAQQGKAINDKILDTFSDQELPKPSLGDLSDLKALSIKVRRERSPNVLGYTYYELCDLDAIKVELMPEKKGLILKHVEYEVTSKRYSATVMRRYNDFHAFHEMLLLRYPYRIVPRIPPKKMMMGDDREFIEQRRRSLKRYLTLVVRHPVLSYDQIVKYFLTFSGSDLTHKVKDHFRGVPDEFMTSELAPKAKDLVPMDTQMQFSNSRTHINTLLNSVCKIKDVAERLVMRATGYAGDMLILGKELSILSTDPTSVSAWATGTSDTWTHLKRGLKPLSMEYAKLADKASCQAVQEEQAIVDELNLFLDLLYSYRDLCERQEKGVVQDHQRALQKMGQYKKKRMSATIQSSGEGGNVEQLEHRILEQESQISNMENRNYYSLHCLQMETQLIHANLEGLFSSLQSMVFEEAKAHTELGQLWDQVKPIITNILPRDHLRNGTTSNSTSPKTSPVGSPVNTHPGIRL